jgi:uncharacterized protein YqfB (UPF0267 family)
MNQFINDTNPLNSRYDYNKSYIYFNTVVADTDLRTIVDKGEVHYCKNFDIDILHLERHDKTSFTAIIELYNGKEIKFTEYSMPELDAVLQKAITPIWLMKEIYDDVINENLLLYRLGYNLFNK